LEPTALPQIETDKVMRNAKLARLHAWLAQNIDDYDGLYEAGSVPAGDPWVDGRTDREVAIVVGGTITGEIRGRIQEQLAIQGFDDTYLFNLTPRRGFLTTQVHHDIAMKFRGQVLFGKDLLTEKETPPREFAARYAQERMGLLFGQLNIRMLNAKCWSVEHLRNDLYDELKLMFLALADKKYAETGEYPVRRLDVAEAYGCDDLRQLYDCLLRIDHSGQEDLIRTAQLAITVLDRLRRRSV
jgi:hypothetical protein